MWYIFTGPYPAIETGRKVVAWQEPTGGLAPLGLVIDGKVPDQVFAWAPEGGPDVWYRHESELTESELEFLHGAK